MFKVKQHKGKGMEATIKFNLDEESDQHLFEVMTKAKDLVLAIQEFDKRLRAMHKYEDVSDAYNYREILRVVLQDHNVNHLI